MSRTDSSVVTAEKNLATLRERYRKLLKLHDEVSQSYHRLANIINQDAHTSNLWISCIEETCKANAKTVTLLMNSETD